MKLKKIINKTRQNFLLSFFTEDKYQEKELNGYWLIKTWNRDLKEWQVSIYSKESYKNYKEYKTLL